MRVSGVSRRDVLRLSAGMVIAGSFVGTAGRAAAQTPETDATKTAVANGEEVTVTHAQGEMVVPLNPQTVFSFDLSSVDTLDALGVSVAGLPQATTLAGHLEKFAGEEYVNAGTLFEPDYEAVAAAAPDLIIVAARSAEALPELAKIAPTVDLTAAPGGDVIGDLRQNVQVLSTIFGKEAEAEELLAGIDTQVSSLQEAASGVGTGLLIMVSGGELTALAPGGHRGGLIYTTLGIQPPVDDVEAATHGEAISFEFLLEHNPDWLFVIDRDVATGEAEGASAAEVLDNDIVRETTAWQQEQIVYLDPFTWYITMGGVTSVQTMLGQLETAFGLA